MRKLINIRHFGNEFSDITGNDTYQGFCPADNKTYVFTWPIDEPAPIDGLILNIASLTHSKFITK